MFDIFLIVEQVGESVTIIYVIDYKIYQDLLNEI